jgi:hypothetical protein
MGSGGLGSDAFAGKQSQGERNFESAKSAQYQGSLPLGRFPSLVIGWLILACMLPFTGVCVGSAVRSPPGIAFPPSLVLLLSVPPDLSSG